MGIPSSSLPVLLLPLHPPSFFFLSTPTPCRHLGRFPHFWFNNGGWRGREGRRDDPGAAPTTTAAHFLLLTSPAFFRLSSAGGVLNPDTRNSKKRRLFSSSLLLFSSNYAQSRRPLRNSQQGKGSRQRSHCQACLIFHDPLPQKMSHDAALLLLPPPGTNLPTKRDEFFTSPFLLKHRKRWGGALRAFGAPLFAGELFFGEQGTLWVWEGRDKGWKGDHLIQ